MLKMTNHCQLSLPKSSSSHPLQDDSFHYHSRHSLLGTSYNDHSAAEAQAPDGPQVKPTSLSQSTRSPTRFLRCLPLGDCAWCSFLGGCLSWGSQTTTTWVQRYPGCLLTTAFASRTGRGRFARWSHGASVSVEAMKRWVYCALFSFIVVSGAQQTMWHLYSSGCSIP